LLARAAEWNYGDRGPREWPALDSAFAICGQGDQQSPVDLEGGIWASVPTVRVHWKSARSTVWNNGHTIQVVVPEGSSLDTGSSGLAPLSQFHFHTPSEHAISAKRSAMEAHFVHQQRTGAIIVLAVLLEGGGQNANFSAIMRMAPRQPDQKKTSPTAIDPASLLPSSLQKTWRYRGSLTTPPCSQTVEWIVCEEPVTVAEADIVHFRALYAMNARPLQPLNRRYLLRTR
jgi:carbonic anhydrase